MDIGSANNMKPADIAADLAASMTERIQSAHEAAEAGEADGDVAPDKSGVETERNVDTVGAELRSELESIVADIVEPGSSGPDDLIGEVIDIVVDHRLQQGEIPGGEDYRDQVAEQLQSDPIVVGQLDDIMQEIARDLALRDR